MRRKRPAAIANVLDTVLLRIGLCTVALEREYERVAAEQSSSQPGPKRYGAASEGSR